MNGQSHENSDSAVLSFQHLDIAVLIPCYNESLTIGLVVRDFSKILPNARIYVYDNASADDTFQVAAKAGAIVRTEHRKGKGYVVRRMFRDIDADVYILIDGDDTYDAFAAPAILEKLLSGPFDKVNGIRVPVDESVFRAGHAFGNRMFTWIVRSMFGAQSNDMLSGYKALSRRFVKSFPAFSTGFEIETELLIHAIELDMPTSEIQTAYRSRPAGSASKLSTIKDGFKISMFILQLTRDLMPLQFFSIVGLFLLAGAFALGGPVVTQYIETGLVPRLPTFVLSVGLTILCFLSLSVGLILDSVAKGRRESKLNAYLSYAALGNRAKPDGELL